MLRAMAAIAAMTILSPALSGEGRIPVYQKTDITEPGSYVVTRDIAVSVSPAIRIYSDGVSLDLNGHSLSSTDNSDAVIYVSVVPIDSGGVRIHDGRLLGGGYGIRGSQTKKLFVENVEISGSSIHGIELQQAGYFEVVSCVITDTGTRGLNANGNDPGGCTGRVVDNSISGGLQLGMLLTNFSEGEVAGNQLELTGEMFASIQIQTVSETGLGANLIARNRIRHNGSSGIAVTGEIHGNVIVDNVIHYTGATESFYAGIAAETSGNYIARNIVTDQYHGISVGVDGNNHIEANKLLGNDYGIYFPGGANNTYRDNILLGNSLGAIGGGGAASAIDAGGNIVP